MHKQDDIKPPARLVLPAFVAILTGALLAGCIAQKIAGHAPAAASRSVSITESGQETSTELKPLELAVTVPDLNTLALRMTGAKSLSEKPSCADIARALGNDGKRINFYRHFLPIDGRGGIPKLPIRIDAPKALGCDTRQVDFPYSAERGYADWIDDIVAGIRGFVEQAHRDGVKPVVYVFIHGGLNDYESSLNERIARDFFPIVGNDYPEDRASSAAGCRRQAGDRAATQGRCIRYYPLFLVWDSGLSTYRDSLAHYSQGEWDTDFFHPWLTPLRTPFRLLARDIPDFAFHAMFNYAGSLERWFDQTRLDEPPDPGKGPALAGPRFSCRNLQTWLGEHAKPGEEASGHFRKAFRCLDELKSERGVPVIEADYGKQEFLYQSMLPARLITVPATDTVGKVAWKNMLARTRFGMHRPCVDLYSSDDHHHNCEKGAYYTLFHELDRLLQPDPDRNDRMAMGTTPPGESDKGFYDDLEITLTGHSMGTIVASEIISAFPDLPYHDVVFLGAAVSIREFLDSVQPVIAHRAEHWRNAVATWNSLQTALDDDAVDRACLDGELAKYIQSIKHDLNPKNGKKHSPVGKSLRRLEARVASATDECRTAAVRARQQLEFVSDNLDRLKARKPFHFFNLSLDERAEAREFDGSFEQKLIPRGSLLEYIDAMYETPADFLERTMGKWRNVVSVNGFFNREGVEEFLHFEKFDLSCASPLSHSDLASNQSKVPLCKSGDRKSQSPSGQPPYGKPPYWAPLYWRWDEHYLDPAGRSQVSARL